MKATHEKLTNTLKAGVCAFALVGFLATNTTPAYATAETKSSSIKLAQELGYGQKKDFEHFYEEIDKIRDKTSDGKSGTGFFDVIKDYMTSMTKDSQPEKTPNKT